MRKKDWNKHNLQVLQKKCNMYSLNISKDKLVALLRDVAQKIVNSIDSITSIPNYTGNLRDSHGVGVYVNGSLSAYIPTKTATKPQRCGLNYHNVYNIWGTEYLSQALQDATSTYSKGIWIVLFASVPYAYYVNENNAKAGFFDEIADEVVSNILSGLQRLNVKNIPNILGR